MCFRMFYQKEVKATYVSSSRCLDLLELDHLYDHLCGPCFENVDGMNFVDQQVEIFGVATWLAV